MSDRDPWERFKPAESPAVAQGVDQWSAYQNAMPGTEEAPNMVSTTPWIDTAKKRLGEIEGAIRTGINTATFGMADRIAAAGETMVGRSPSYEEALKEQTGQTQKIREEQPIATLAGDVIGGAGTGVGLARAGLTLAGRGGGLLGRSAVAAGEGAAYGAAQGAGQTYTGNPEDYLKAAGGGAIIGGLGGAAAPSVASVAEGAVRGAVNRGWGPNRVPAPVGTAAIADEAGLRSLPPEGMLVDAGPSLRGLGQGAVTGSGGPGRSALVNALRDRDAGTARAVTGSVDQNFGPTVTPSHVELAVRERMQAMSPRYDAVMANARAIDAQPVHDFLTNRISTTRGPAQAALQQVRGMLELPDAPGVLDPHPRSLQAARTAVRGMQESAEDPAVRAQLGHVYDRMTRELQNKVPGIRELDSAYAELGSQERALTHTGPGARAFTTDRASAMRPVELAETLTEAAQPKGMNVGPSAEAFRLTQAARAELDRIVGTNANDLNALERLLGQPQDWNAQKLGIVFGQDRADALMRTLSDRRNFRQSYQDIVQGSQTAQRVASKEGLEEGRGRVPLDTTFTGMLVRGAQEGISRLRGNAAEANRDSIAQVLATQDPAEIRRLADRFLSVGQSREQRARITNWLALHGMIGGGAATTPSATR